MGNLKKKLANSQIKFGLYRARDEVKPEGQMFAVVACFPTSSDADLYVAALEEGGFAKPIVQTFEAPGLGPYVSVWHLMVEGKVSTQKRLVQGLEFFAIRYGAISLRLCAFPLVKK